MAIRDRSAVRFSAIRLVAWALGSASLATAGCASGPSATATPATGPSGDTQFFVSGAVTHPGAYSLADGRKITLKQALVGAGLPDPVPPTAKVALICPGAHGAEGECDSFDLSAVLTTPAGDRELIAGEVVVLRTPLPAGAASAPASAPAN